MAKTKRRTVHDDLKRLKHDEDFTTPPLEHLTPIEFPSCPHPAGSQAKIETMRQRVENGLPIFHPHDNPERIGPSISERTLRNVAAIRVVKVSHVFTLKKPIT